MAASPWQSGIATMPLDGDVFYKPSDDDGAYTMELRYYTEVLDGTTGTHTYNGGQYVLDHKDSFSDSDNGWTTTKEDHYPIIGFTYTNNLRDGSSFRREGNTRTYYVEFFYIRNDYQIIFVNGGSTESTVTKQYGASLDGVDHTPARPANIPTGYVFMGWYDNELCEGDPYVFDGKTMPAANITVYAKWAAPEIKATFYTGRVGTENNTVLKEVPVNYGSIIPQSEIPDYPVTGTDDWIGWVTANGVVFNFNTKLYADIDLYPYYVSTVHFTVTYDANGDSGEVPVDNNKYVELSSATVLSPSNLKAPVGKVFLGWNTAADGSGTTYQPNSSVVITGDVVLYAMWGNEAPGANSLTYDANNGSGATYVVENIPNNASHTVLTREATGFEYLNHEFLGWSTDANATVAEYEPGDSVIVDGADVNILYAVWEIKYSSYTVNYYWNGTETKIAESKIVNEVEIGSVITNEAPIAIGGYTALPNQTSNLTIVEDSRRTSSTSITTRM